MPPVVTSCLSLKIAHSSLLIIPEVSHAHQHFLSLLLLPFVLLTAALCLAVLLGGQDFVHALLNVAVLP